MPAIYLSHGAPPVFDDRHWIDQLFEWSRSMPKPKAILVVSAHWESAPTALSAADAGTPLVYDFGGFAPEYHRMTYPTPDAGELKEPPTPPISAPNRRCLPYLFSPATPGKYSAGGGATATSLCSPGRR